MVLKDSYPKENGTYSTISHIDLEFDLSNYYTQYDENVVGVGAIIAKNKIKLYKGDIEDNNVICSCPSALKRIQYEAGATSISIDLGGVYELETGQSYTIVLPSPIIFAAIGSQSSDRIDYLAETKITFYGGEDETTDSLVFKSSNPVGGSEVKEFDVMTFNFSNSIELADDAKASLNSVASNGSTTLLKEAFLKVSDNDNTVAEVDFDGFTCTAATKYTITVPKDAVKLSGTEMALSYPISLSFTGYELFGNKSVSPASGSVLTSVSNVTLTPDFPDGRTHIAYAGDSAYYKPTYLYKGYKSADDMGELVGTYYTEAQTSSIKIKLDTQLAAGVTYALVIPQSTVPYPIDNGSGKLISGYYSAADTILYTGSAYAGVTYKVGNTTLVVDSVRRGSSVTLSVAQCDTISLDKLTLNGADVTSEISSDSTYTISSLMTDAELVAYTSYTNTRQPDPTYYSVDYKVVATVTVDDETTATDAVETTAQVAEGKDFGFTVNVPDEYWTVDSVVVGGTALAAADSYAVTVTSDTTVVAYYSYSGDITRTEDTTSGIVNVNGQEVRVTAQSGAVRLDNVAAGDRVTLYTIGGMRVGSWTAEKDTQTITAQPGVYLVQVIHDGKAMAVKVTVK